MLWNFIDTKNPTGKKVLVITAIIIVVLILFFSIRGFLKKSDDRQEKRDLEDEAERTGVDPRKLLTDAEQLKTAFGFGWGWLGVDSWTEDEETIINIVLQYQNSFDLLAEAYRQASERNLYSDLQRYLSSSELSQLSHITGI